MRNRRAIAAIIALLVLVPDVVYSALSARPFAMASPDEMPDLTVGDVLFFPRKPIAGARAMLFVTIENIGTTPTPLWDEWCHVQVSWEGHAQLDLQTHLEGEYISSTVQFSPLFWDAGNYTVEIYVDSASMIAESNEYNNELATTVEVALPKAPKALLDERDFGKEEGSWGYLPAGMTEGYWFDSGSQKASTLEQLPTVNGLPDYSLLGKLDLTAPDSGFESQKPDPACGTTCVAGILRYLSRSTQPTRSDVDETHRGGDCVDMDWMWLDPRSAADAADDRGYEGEAYVNGDFEKLKRDFLDKGIPVMICITNYGAEKNSAAPNDKSLFYGHWIVPICYWENDTLTSNLGLSSPVMIGYYNPWGYQCAMPQSRLELYWTEQVLGRIAAWNRAYVGIRRLDQPKMPSSNFPEPVGDVMRGIEWSSSNLGDSVCDLKDSSLSTAERTAAFFALIGYAVCYVGTWIAGGCVWLGKAIAEGFWKLIDILDDFFTSLGCSWFGWGCKSKKEYFYYFYSIDPTCETPRLLNDMQRKEAIGYLFNSPGQNRTPIYEYAEINETTHTITNYFICTDPDKPETEVPGIRREYYASLGYGLNAVIPGTPCDKLVDYIKAHQLEFDNSIDNIFVPQFHLDDSLILWVYEYSDTEAKPPVKYSFLTTDQDAGTRTFPFLAGDENGNEVGFHFTREYIMGYIPTNNLQGTYPLYRFYVPKKEEFFLHTALGGYVEDLGYVDKDMILSGVSGYIYLQEQPNTIPLYRYRTNDKGAHYLFTTKEVISDKFTKQEVLGYIYPYQEELTTELWLYCYRKVKEE